MIHFYKRFQINSILPPQPRQEHIQPQSQIPGGARSRVEAGTGFSQLSRSRSPSTKRTAEEAELHSQQETAWSTVAGRNLERRQRPVQYGTAKVPVTARGEAAPYFIVVGNTHPQSTEEIIKDVLKNISEGMTGDNNLGEPLEILEVECLTKPRIDGRRIWSRTWRIQVPNRFRDYL